MDLNTEKENYNRNLEQLIGSTLIEVLYFEIEYDSPSFDFPEYHSLDYGIQLKTSNEEYYYIIWDSQYFQFDIKFKKGLIQNEFNPDSKIGCFNVSNTKYWKARIGQKITNISSYWSYVSTGLPAIKTHYPQDIEIIFDNNLNLIVSATEIQSESQEVFISDNITIFFDSHIAIKYGLLIN